MYEKILYIQSTATTGHHHHLVLIYHDGVQLINKNSNGWQQKKHSCKQGVVKVEVIHSQLINN